MVPSEQMSGQIIKPVENSYERNLSSNLTSYCFTFLFRLGEF